MTDSLSKSNYFLQVNEFYKPIYTFYKKRYNDTSNNWVYANSFNSKYEAKMYIDLLGIKELERQEESSKIYGVYYE